MHNNREYPNGNKRSELFGLQLLFCFGPLTEVLCLSQTKSNHQLHSLRIKRNAPNLQAASRLESRGRGSGAKCRQLQAQHCSLVAFHVDSLSTGPKHREEQVLTACPSQHCDVGCPLLPWGSVDLGTEALLEAHFMVIQGRDKRLPKVCT